MDNNVFTDEQINSILELITQHNAHLQYIGARYVPIFGRVGEDSIEWDNTGTYEPLTIVLYQGNSFTSRQFVPVGIEITNQKFWANTGNYNAQIEQYRQEVLKFENRISTNETNIATLNEFMANAENRISTNETNIATLNEFMTNAKKKYVTPYDFGAVGDGIADDTTAIFNAFTNANNYIVLIPNGTFKITNQVKATVDTVVGIGGVITIPSVQTDTIVGAITFSNSDVNITGLRMMTDTNATNTQNNTPSSNWNAISVYNAKTLTVKDCYFENFFTAIYGSNSNGTTDFYCDSCNIVNGYGGFYINNANYQISNINMIVTEYANAIHHFVYCGIGDIDKIQMDNCTVTAAKTNAESSIFLVLALLYSNANQAISNGIYINGCNFINCGLIKNFNAGTSVEKMIVTNTVFDNTGNIFSTSFPRLNAIGSNFKVTEFISCCFITNNSDNWYLFDTQYNMNIKMLGCKVFNARLAVNGATTSATNENASITIENCDIECKIMGVLGAITVVSTSNIKSSADMFSNMATTVNNSLKVYNSKLDAGTANILQASYTNLIALVCNSTVYSSIASQNRCKAIQTVWNEAVFSNNNV